MKPVWASKTLWINVLGGIIGVAGLATDKIPARYAPYVLAVSGIANILLRLITTEGVSLTGA